MPHTSFVQLKEIPSPLSAITMTPLEVAKLLTSLQENITRLLAPCPNRFQTSHRVVMDAIRPFLPTPESHTFIYPAPPDDRTHTLNDVIASIVKSNTPPPNYNIDVRFHTFVDNKLVKLSDPCQNAISEALRKIQSPQSYLDYIILFWQAPVEGMHSTLREFLAKAMATQLQCESVLRLANNSLNLSSVALITLLANPQRITHRQVYTLSIKDKAQQRDVPVIGAFVISRHPENHEGHENPTVLYVPGQGVREFSSPLLLKAILVSDMNTSDANTLLHCVARHQHLHLKNWVTQGLEESQIHLSTTTFSEHFFLDLSLQLIDKQCKDITYAWSSELPERISSKQNAHELIASAADMGPVTTVNESLIKYAGSLIESELEHTEPATESTHLNPIKIHVFAHDDLFDYTETSLYSKYFSWVKEEIESLSGREVKIIFNAEPAASPLKKYNYQAPSRREAIDGWKRLITEYLEKKSQTRSPLDLFLLLTRRTIDWTTEGLAEAIGSQFAIGSIFSDRVPAHEIGHMLGATHEDGEVIFDGWWQETVMHSDVFSGLRGNLYRFSDKNKENIRNYLTQFD